MERREGGFGVVRVEYKEEAIELNGLVENRDACVCGHAKDGHMQVALHVLQQLLHQRSVGVGGGGGGAAGGGACLVLGAR